MSYVSRDQLQNAEGVASALLFCQGSHLTADGFAPSFLFQGSLKRTKWVAPCGVFFLLGRSLDR